MPMELVEFKKNLRSMIEHGEFALPSNVDPDAFRNAAIIGFQENPSIKKCIPESVFRSLRKIASKGLVPDGHEAALVPFKQRDRNGQDYFVCQDIAMIAGIRKLATNSGKVKDLRARAVYQREVDEGRFRLVYGDQEELVHEPILFAERGAIVGMYAIAELTDGTIMRDWMPTEEIEAIRREAPSQRSQKDPKGETPKGAWATSWEQMAGKTVARRLSKRLPLSSEDRRRILEVDGDDAPQFKDVTPKKTLQDRVDEVRQKPEQTAAETVEGEGGQPPSDTQSRSAPSPDDVEDAETVDAEPEQDGEPFTPNPEQGFPMDDEFSEGWKAHEAGDAYESNPYKTVGQQQADSWAGGWMGSQKQKDDKPKKGAKS